MIDKDQSNFNLILNSLQERYGRTVFPFTLPINEGLGFNQVADVLRKQILIHKTDGSGDFSETDPEGEWNNKLRDLHNELIELIAESDESLMEIFFEKGELSEDELRSGLHAAIKSNGLIPVFCMSGESNIGVKRMMDIMAKYAPCAGDFKEVLGTKPGTEESITHGPSISDPLSSIVFNG